MRLFELIYCVLGGFRDTEQQTLMMLAQMGVYPTVSHLSDKLSQPRPLTRFRSAVRVVIAIARLVKAAKTTENWKHLRGL